MSSVLSPPPALILVPCVLLAHSPLHLPNTTNWLQFSSILQSDESWSVPATTYGPSSPKKLIYEVEFGGWLSGGHYSSLVQEFLSRTTRVGTEAQIPGYNIHPSLMGLSIKVLSSQYQPDKAISVTNTLHSLRYLSTQVTSACSDWMMKPTKWKCKTNRAEARADRW